MSEPNTIGAIDNVHTKAEAAINTRTRTAFKMTMVSIMRRFIT